MTSKLETMSFGNGAGSIKHLDEVIQASKSAMTRITVGSITKHERAGNIGDTYYFHSHEQWSLNSLGLPNFGMQVYEELLPEMTGIAHGAGKALWASISPFSAEECAEMTERCFEGGVDGVEINGSCPNVWKGSERKAIPALDPDAAVEMFERLKAQVGGLADVSFKLSPTDDAQLLFRLAQVFRKYRVEQLVCCNAKPDQSGTREDGKPALAFRTDERDQEVKHIGGLGGRKAFEGNLAVAKTMAELLPDTTVIGLGGIFTGADAESYLSGGCRGFMCTTGYMEQGERLFSDLLMQLSGTIAA